MHQLNIAEAKAHLSELIQRAITGDEVVIARDGKPLVRLVPVTAAPTRQLGLARSHEFYMSDDFNAPVDDFAEYSK